MIIITIIIHAIIIVIIIFTNSIVLGPRVNNNRCQD